MGADSKRVSLASTLVRTAELIRHESAISGLYYSTVGSSAGALRLKFTLNNADFPRGEICCAHIVQVQLNEIV